MIPAAFDYLTPTSLPMVVEALSSIGDDAKIIAGGQSLLPMMKLRLARPGVLIDISRVSELRGVEQAADSVIIGALTTHYQIESSELLRERCPLLPRTARVIGDVQVRNRGTIGGSLAHADPAADLPAALLALGAELRARGSDGDRWIRAEEFFLGLMETALKPTEVLASIRVPVLTDKTGTSYQKVAQKASGFAIVGVAVRMTLAEDGVCSEIGVGVTGLGPKPFRAGEVEGGLRGQRPDRSLIERVASRVTQGTEPLEDIHASAEFRSHLAQVYTARSIEEAAKEAGF